MPGDVQQQAIPFVPHQQSGLDPLGGGSPIAKDLVSDGLGTVRRRPGVTLVVTEPNALGIQGMYATTQGRVFLVAGKLPDLSRVYELVGDTLSEHTDGTSRFPMDRRPVFAETEALLLISTGRKIHSVDLRTPATVGLLAGPPPAASHVVANAQRLLGNDVVIDTTKVSFSAPASGTVSIEGHEQWVPQTTSLGTSGFFSAESRPDPVVALAESSSEVWAFGSTNLQIFAPDVTVSYLSVLTREFGCSAPYSPVRDDQSFAWLDDRRRFVHSDGRSVTVLSDDVKENLDDMLRIDDAFGFRILLGSTDVLLWRFPTDGRDLVFSRQGGWATWTLAADAHTTVPGSNRQLVGFSDGAVGELDTRARTDRGVAIEADVTTGRIDRGTPNRKHCLSVMVSLRRGQDVAPHTNVAELLYRDDEGDWSQPIPIDVGDSPDRLVVAPQLRSLGVYRSRQWRIRFSGTADIALRNVIEEFVVLDN